MSLGPSFPTNTIIFYLLEENTMRRYLSLILSALLTFFILSFQNAPVYALGKSAWEKEYITDAFGDPTEEYCLTNCKVFNGTYNSASISKGKLSVDLFVQREGYGVQAFVVLFIDGKDQLKNGTNSQVDYAITIKGTDGKKTNTIGTVLRNTDRIEIYNPVSLADALSSGKGQVSVYIEENGQTLNNFLFEADCGNFGKLYEQEILVPIKNDYYSYAESLLQLKRYDDAIAAFTELGEYRDSKARIAEAYEAQKADAYAKAEELLRQKRYDDAITAFTELGEYRDSKARIAEVYEAQKADVYAKAEELLRQKRYDDAISAFTELGDYSDSKDRIAEAYEAQKADAYAKAEELLRQKRYDDAISAFTELGDYSESKDRIAEAQEEKREDLYNRAIQLVASKDYDAALPLLNEIKGYKDTDSYLSKYYYLPIEIECLSSRNAQYVFDYSDQDLITACTIYYANGDVEEKKFDSPFTDIYGNLHSFEFSPESITETSKRASGEVFSKAVYDVYGNLLIWNTMGKDNLSKERKLTLDEHHNIVAENSSNNYDDEGNLLEVQQNINNLHKRSIFKYKWMYLETIPDNYMEIIWRNIRLSCGSSVW